MAEAAAGPGPGPGPGPGAGPGAGGIDSLGGAGQGLTLLPASPQPHCSLMVHCTPVYPLTLAASSALAWPPGHSPPCQLNLRILEEEFKWGQGQIGSS